MAKTERLSSLKKQTGSKSKSAATVIQKDADSKTSEKKVSTTVDNKNTVAGQVTSKENVKENTESTIATGDETKATVLNTTTNVTSADSGVACVTYSFGTTTTLAGNNNGPSVSFFVSEYVSSGAGDSSSSTTKDQSTDDKAVQDTASTTNVATMDASLKDTVNQKKLQNATTNTGTGSGDSLQNLSKEKIEENKKKQAQYEQEMSKLNQQLAKNEITQKTYDKRKADVEKKLNITNEKSSWNSEASKNTQANNTVTPYKNTMENHEVNTFTSWLSNSYKSTVDTVSNWFSSSNNNIVQEQNKIYPKTDNVSVSKDIDINKQKTYYEEKQEIQNLYDSKKLSDNDYKWSLDSLYTGYYGDNGKVYKTDSVCSNYIKTTNDVVTGNIYTTDISKTLQTGNKATFQSDKLINNNWTSEDQIQTDNLQTAMNTPSILDTVSNYASVGLNSLKTGFSELASAISGAQIYNLKKDFVNNNSGLLGTLSTIDNTSKILVNVANSATTASPLATVATLASTISPNGVGKTIQTVSNTMTVVDNTIKGVSQLKNVFDQTASSVSTITGSMSSIGNAANTVRSSISAIDATVSGITSTINAITGGKSNKLSKTATKVTEFAAKANAVYNTAVNVAKSVDAITGSLGGVFGGSSGTSLGSIFGGDSGSGLGGLLGGTSSKNSDSGASGGQKVTVDGKTQTANSTAYKSNMDKLTQTMQPQQKITMAFVLPLPDTIQDSYTFNWSFIDKQNGSWLASLSNIDTSKDLGDNIKGIGSNLLVTALKKLGDSTGIGSDNVKLGQAKAKMLLNPQKIISFDSWEPRKFDIKWTLYPRSKEEAQQIERMVNELKFKALPSGDADGGAFISYPASLKFHMTYDGNRLDKYPSSESCVINTITATYSKEVMEDGAPKSIEVNLNLTETVLLTKESFEKYTGVKPSTESSAILKQQIEYAENSATQKDVEIAKDVAKGQGTEQGKTPNTNNDTPKTVTPPGGW